MSQFSNPFADDSAPVQKTERFSIFRRKKPTPTSQRATTYQVGATLQSLNAIRANEHAIQAYKIAVSNIFSAAAELPEFETKDIRRSVINSIVEQMTELNNSYQKLSPDLQNQCRDKPKAVYKAIYKQLLSEEQIRLDQSNCLGDKSEAKQPSNASKTKAAPVSQPKHDEQARHLTRFQDRGHIGATHARPYSSDSNSSNSSSDSSTASDTPPKKPDPAQRILAHRMQKQKVADFNPVVSSHDSHGQTDLADKNKKVYMR